MPVFKNTSDVDVVLEGVRIPARGGEHKTTSNFIELPEGVEKISDLPVWNPTIVSTVESGSSGTVSVEIPDTYRLDEVSGAEMPLLGYVIVVRGLTGKATIKFNGVAVDVFGTVVTVVPGDYYKWTILQRKVEVIDITFVDASTSVKIDVSASRM